LGRIISNPCKTHWYIYNGQTCNLSRITEVSGGDSCLVIHGMNISLNKPTRYIFSDNCMELKTSEVHDSKEHTRDSSYHQYRYQPKELKDRTIEQQTNEGFRNQQRTNTPSLVGTRSPSARGEETVGAVQVGSTMRQRRIES
jgi:hypothetical protein